MSNWIVNSRTIHEAGNNPFGNRFYGYGETELELPDGRPAKYFGIVVPNCVHVVALDDDETTFLVRQSRPNALAIAETVVPETLELPGGFANPDKTLAESANEELAEEVGLTAANLEQVGTLYPSPGASNEQDHIFMATDLSVIDVKRHEATEQDMGIVSGKFGDLYKEMALQQRPVSAQTLAAMAMVAVRL